MKKLTTKTEQAIYSTNGEKTYTDISQKNKKYLVNMGDDYQYLCLLKTVNQNYIEIPANCIWSGYYQVKNLNAGDNVEKRDVFLIHFYWKYNQKSLSLFLLKNSYVLKNF